MKLRGLRRPAPHGIVKTVHINNQIFMRAHGQSVIDSGKKCARLRIWFGHAILAYRRQFVKTFQVKNGTITLIARRRHGSYPIPIQQAISDAHLRHAKS